MDKETKKCPYCGETIMAIAKKCRHCGEWLIEKEVEEPSAKNEESAEIKKLSQQEGELGTNEKTVLTQPAGNLSSSNRGKSSKVAVAVVVAVLLVACGISSYYLVEPMYDYLIDSDVSFNSCEPLSYVLAIGLSTIVALLVGWFLIKSFCRK